MNARRHFDDEENGEDDETSTEEMLDAVDYLNREENAVEEILNESYMTSTRSPSS